MVLFIKVNTNLCAENVNIEAHKNIFNHIVALHIKNITTLNKRKSEYRNTGMH